MTKRYPHIQWRARGHRLRSSRWNARLPFDASEIEELARNPHLAHHINTLLPQVFPAPPQVHVIDQDGNEPNAELSKAISDSLRDAGLYASMRRAYIDCMLYGCAVRSVSITSQEDPKFTRIAEIRDLPASSFSTSPSKSGAKVITPNQLMPGLVIRDGKPEAYQTDPYTGVVHQLDNWDVICDPTTQQPFGEAFCLPIYPILDSIAIAEAALDASVQRRGVPLLTLKIKDELPANLLKVQDEILADAASFVQNWGMTSGAILPRGVEIPPMQSGIIDGSEAHERILDLDGLLDSFFSPASALSPGRTDQQALFGASQQSRAQIWRAHITGQQAWIEDAYERLIESVGVLGANGCPDTWKLEIRLDRPSEYDIHTRKMTELQLAVSAGVIGKAELRNHLDNLDLAEAMPDDLIGMPSVMPVGNVSDIPLPDSTTGMDEDVGKVALSEAEIRQKIADEQDEALISALDAHARAWQPRLQAWLEAQQKMTR